MEQDNSWGNATLAESYSKLEFPNTYYLAYRDLSGIISAHVIGFRAIDFGCGTGRSTRFLKQLGFSITGIDISPDMLAIACKLNIVVDYQHVSNGKYNHPGINNFDLIQSIFTFDNFPDWNNRINILKSLSDLLKDDGCMILLDSTPELYINEWASFTTKDFPENRNAKTGDIVRDIMLDVKDCRPVEDVLWRVSDYHKLFKFSGLTLEATYKPLGNENEPYNWISKTTIAPWIIFVLKKFDKFH